MQTRKYRYDFRGHNLIPAAADAAGGPLIQVVTSTSGAPVWKGTTAAGVQALLTSDAEVQNVCLYMGDVLPFDIDDLIAVEFVAKTVAALDAATMLAFGLAGARNDAIDSIAQHALFRCIGDNSIVVETDDGTNDNNDKATGFSMGTDWQRFRIDFSERITTQEPPSVSLGRASNIGFYVGNSNGSLRRVASGTRFDMSNYTGGLQVFAQLQKTADDNVDSLSILEVEVEVKLPELA